MPGFVLFWCGRKGQRKPYHCLLTLEKLVPQGWFYPEEGQQLPGRGDLMEPGVMSDIKLALPKSLLNIWQGAAAQTRVCPFSVRLGSTDCDINLVMHCEKHLAVTSRRILSSQEGSGEGPFQGQRWEGVCPVGGGRAWQCHDLATP